MTGPVTPVNLEDSPSITPEPLSELAAFFKASSDTLRLEVLRVLARDSFGVLELSTILDTKQSAMSHHLKVLASAGLVDTRREGNSIFYHRSPQAKTDSVQPLQDALFSNLDITDIRPKTDERRKQVRAVRASSSQLFFTENAYKFREQQDLIASYEQYADSVKDLVQTLCTDPSATALEIGPGEGTFLKELSPVFKSITALDNSQEMLNKSSEFVSENNLGNITLMLGDTKTAISEGILADCAICNMVLHHIPSPADTFFDVANLLTDNGTFFITDLCSHNQTWVKEAVGDLWLGFEPNDLTRWAQAAGFEEGKSIYLALRNGFRIQIRQFSKVKSS